MLTDFGFMQHTVYETLEKPNAEFADLDGDGDLDVLVAGKYDGIVQWYRNEDGKGTFSAPILFHDEGDRTVTVAGSHDLDRDGDLDVIVVAGDTVERARIVWYENLDGRGVFANPQVGGTVARFYWDADFQFANVDGDEHPDMVTSLGEWLEYQPNGLFERNSLELDTALDVPFVIDVNDDGVADIVSWNRNDQLIDIHVNDGTGRFTKTSEIEAGGYVRDIAIADMDNDDDNDLVIDSERLSVGWYELDNKFDVVAYHDLVQGQWIERIAVSDIDADGDADLILGEDSGLSWMENRSGNFETPLYIDRDHGTHEIHVGDIDSDGTTDLLISRSSCDLGQCFGNQVRWYANAGGAAFGRPQDLLPPPMGRLDIVADLDGDHDSDAFFNGWRELGWLEFDDSTPMFTDYRNLIETDVRFAIEAMPNDMDDDGDADLLVSQYPLSWLCDSIDPTCRPRIKWLEFDDGDFGESHAVADLDRYVNSFVPFDVDGDNDVDVVWIDGEREVFVSKNDDGVFQLPSPWIEFSTSLDYAKLVVADLDGDDDDDLIIVAPNEGGFSWLEFDNGRLASEANFVALRAGLSSVQFGDIDGDGDLDVNGRVGRGTINWFEHIGSRSAFVEHHVIDLGIDNRVPLASALVDVDSDGDQDIVATTAEFLDFFPTNGQLAWLENQNGSGDFADTPQLISMAISVGQRAFSYDEFVSADFDQDGDMDLLATGSNYIVYLENRPIGDANNDGIFNSSDLVKIFQAGEYEDGVQGN
ncbi:MAG: VCBS repeat-containing protein, partial [Planctomycetales bacterium]|nr:VCBS repeat-containing protein [Planctomycetales bacterium]